MQAHVFLKGGALNSNNYSNIIHTTPMDGSMSSDGRRLVRKITIFLLFKL